MQALLYFVFSIFWAPIAVYRDYKYLQYADPREKAAKTRLYYPRAIAAALGLALFIIVTALAARSISAFTGAAGGLLAVSIIFFGSAFLRLIFEAIGQHLLKNTEVNDAATIEKSSSHQAIWQQTLYGDSHPGYSSEEIAAIENQNAPPDSTVGKRRIRSMQFEEDNPRSPESKTSTDDSDHDLSVENDELDELLEGEKNTPSTSKKILYFLYKTPAPRISTEWFKGLIVTLGLMGLSAAAAFGLFGASFLAVPGQFLMDGWLASPWVPIGLLAFSVAIISQIIIRFVKSSVSTLPGKMLEAAIKGQEILTQWGVPLVPEDRPDNHRGDRELLSPVAREVLPDEPEEAPGPLSLNSPNAVSPFMGNINPLDPAIDALLTHIEQIRALFGNKEWPWSLRYYQSHHIDRDHFHADGRPYLGEAGQDEEGIFLRPHPIKADLKTLMKLDRFSELTDRRRWVAAHSKEIRHILTRIAPTVSNNGASFDPDFRPQLPGWNKKSLIIFSGLLLIVSVSILFLIFTGFIPFGSAALAMPLAVTTGIVSWLAGKEVLKHTSGGPYGELTAITGAAATIFTTLTGLTCLALFLKTLNIAAINSIPLTFLTTLLPMLGGMAIFIPLTIYFARSAYVYAGRSKDDNNLYLTVGRSFKRQSTAYRWTKRLLTSVKILFIFGFLFLAFLTVAALFNLSGLGGVSNLMQFAYTIIEKALGIGGYIIGTEWLIVFTITIFAVSIFAAATLTKNVLEKSPTNASELKASDGWEKLKTFSGQLLKLAFTLGVMAALISADFLPGANKSLLLPFILIAVVMPLFSGNANFRYLAQDKSGRLHRANNWYNKVLGIASIRGQSPDEQRIGLLLLRELGVGILMFTLPFAFSAAANFTFNPAVLILTVGAGITMLTRWSAMVVNSFTNKIRIHAYAPEPHLSRSPYALLASPPSPQPADNLSPKAEVRIDVGQQRALSLPEVKRKNLKPAAAVTNRRNHAAFLSPPRKSDPPQVPENNFPFPGDAHMT